MKEAVSKEQGQCRTYMWAHTLLLHASAEQCVLLLCYCSPADTSLRQSCRLLLSPRARNIIKTVTNAAAATRSSSIVVQYERFDCCAIDNVCTARHAKRQLTSAIGTPSRALVLWVRRSVARRATDRTYTKL